MTVYHHFEEINSLAVIKEDENIQFERILRETDHTELDQTVFKLQEIASKAIDCTQCGNCCRSFMINVEEKEADKVSHSLQISRSDFDEKYIEKSQNGRMILNTIPCSFLKENKCTIYENRFSGCREFPALHLPDVHKRLFSIFQNYSRCPIIFTVIEELKSTLRFNLG